MRREPLKALPTKKVDPEVLQGNIGFIMRRELMAAPSTRKVEQSQRFCKQTKG
jgi:hypothetical protein